MAGRTLIVAALLLGAGMAGEALARHRSYSTGAARKRSVNAIQSQVSQFEAIASQADKVVSENKAKVDMANNRLSNDRETIATAQGDGKKASSGMKEAEAQMYEKLGEESDVVKAKEKYEATRAALQAERNRVLKSPEYQAEVANSAGEPQRASELPKIREKFLKEDSEYQRALTMYEVARKQFNGERTEALSHDESWLAASEDKKNALLAEAKALTDGKSGGLQKLPAKTAMRNAQKIADQARAYASQGRSMLGQMGAGMPTSKPTPSTPTRSAASVASPGAPAN